MYQTSEEREPLLIPMGVLIAFALLMATRHMFSRATPVLEQAAESVPGRHASSSRVNPNGRDRESTVSVAGTVGRDSGEKTPTYQRAQSIPRAGQVLALREGLIDEALPRSQEALYDDTEDELNSAPGVFTGQQASRDEAAYLHRRAHSSSEDHFQPTPGPRHFTPAASIFRGPASRTMSRASSQAAEGSLRPDVSQRFPSDSATAASRATSRSRHGSPAPAPAQEHDGESVSGIRRSSSVAHHPLPPLLEDEVVEDQFPASAPLPPKIPSRRRGATPDVCTPPVSSRSSQISSEPPSASSRTPTPAPPVSSRSSRFSSEPPSASSRTPTPAPPVNTGLRSQAAESAPQVPSLSPRAQPRPLSAPRAPSTTSSALCAPSVPPFAPRALSITSSASRSPSMTTSTAPRGSRTTHAVSSPLGSSVIPSTEIAVKYPRQVYRRPQSKPKSGSSRSAGSEEATENEDANRSPGHIVTAWFDSKSDALLQYPPDLRLHPELQFGDIFYHSTGSRYQLWCWTFGNNGEAFWDEAFWGYERQGLFLTLTGSLQKPSWVNKRRLAVRERELAMQHGGDE